MDKEHLVKLTLGLYKVTEFLPGNEPLKIALREKAVEILAEGVLLFIENPVGPVRGEASNGVGAVDGQREKILSRILGNISILQAYFELAKKQNWLKEANFSVLAEAYQGVEEAIRREMMGGAQKTLFSAASAKPAEAVQKENFKGKAIPAASVSLKELTKARHKQLIKILQEKGTVQVKDIKLSFPKANPRALRRDMRELLLLGFVERVGEKNNTAYKLRSG